MSEFYIQQKDWRKIINYAKAREQECGDEIGGMAIIKKDDDDDYIILEPTILKQETTGSTCTLDKDELAQYYSDMAHKHGNKIHFLWWHSHAKMAAFWSGTDTSTMTEYKNSDWSAFLVVNVREEYKFRVQYWHPYELGEDIELTVISKDKKSVIPKSILKEIEEKCEEKKHTGIVNTGWTNRNTGYTYLRGNYNQTSLFNKNTELTELLEEVGTLMDMGSYGSNYYGFNLSIQESPIAYLHDQLDDGNSKYCEGAITYEKYKAAIDEFNDTLRRLEGNDSPKIRVQLFSQNELLDKCMTMNPLEFITIDGDSPIALWSQQENNEQVKDWNESFGVKHDK